jgi:hypothetical protein
VRTVGNRRQPQIESHPSGEALVAGALFSESIAHLAKSTFIPKGVYRFKSHEAANKHQNECLARGMALLAAQRSHDGTDKSPSKGLLLTKQTLRDKDAADRMVLERALAVLQGGAVPGSGDEP